jgi:hypothetical protein
VKSDRQAARIAFVVAEAARTAGAADAGAVVAGAAGAKGGSVTAAGGGGAAAGAATGTGVATPRAAPTATWQAGESFGAFARRHSTSSGLLGWIHEQCERKSPIVQACWTAPSWFAAAGSDGSGCGAALAGCGGSVGSTAPTALPQAGDKEGALRWRHSSASRPPGSTPEQ